MADPVTIELSSPSGTTLRVEWEPQALLRGSAAGERWWRLEGELDWDEIERLRVVSASLPDGRGLGLVAVLPAGATGHGEEVVAATLVDKRAAEPVPGPLLSVETGAGGLPRRVGLELYTAADAMPLRVAADVSSASRDPEGELERVHAELTVRLDGKRGSGTYDVLGAAGDVAR